MPSNLQSQYDDAATWWQSTIYRLGYRHSYEELMPRAVAGLAPKSVVDVGCGTGDLAAAYCIRCGAPERLTLIDGAQSMVAAAKTNLRHIAPDVDSIHALLGDNTAQGQYDLVLCAHLIEHLRDPAQGLSQLADLIAPGGHLLILISKPHWCQWPIWLKWRHQWFSETQIRAMAAGAGLRVQQSFGLNSGPPSRTSLAYLMDRSAVQ